MRFYVQSDKVFRITVVHCSLRKILHRLLSGPVCFVNLKNYYHMNLTFAFPRKRDCKSSE